VYNIHILSCSPKKIKKKKKKRFEELKSQIILHSYVTQIRIIKKHKRKKNSLQSIDSTNWQIKETKKSINPKTRTINFILNLP
jgi:hypothetical protein